MGYTDFKIHIKLISYQFLCTVLGLKHQNRSENWCNDQIFAQHRVKVIQKYHIYKTQKFLNLLILSWEQLPIAIQYLDWHIICRSTYSMLINIHTMYVNWHTVCRSRYINACMPIDILYVDWHTVSGSTYTVCMWIDILYVNQHMSIEILSIGCGA